MSWPVELVASVTLVEDALTVTAYALTVQVRISAEAAEWIWHDILGDGDRRIARALPEAKVRLFCKSVEITVGGYVVRRPISNQAAQRFVARKADPEANMNHEVVYR